MDTLTKKQTVLLMISLKSIFNTTKEVLEERGWETREDIGDIHEFDFVMMDSFYFQAGAVHFIKRENPNMPIVLIVKEQEINKELLEASDDFAELDEIVVIPSWQGEKTHAVISRWLRESEMRYLLEAPLPEFGSGRWVKVAMIAQSAS